MRFYIDTSVLAAYYCPEALSPKAETFLMSYAQPTLSDLTEVELFSAIARKVRERSISRADGGRIIARFVSHVDQNFYDRLAVDRQHYRLARDWIGLFKFGLRSLDALHLAITSSEGLTLVTADKSLMQSAEALGLKYVFLGTDVQPRGC